MGCDGQIFGIEVQLIVKHLLWLKEQLEDDITDLFVLTTGKYAYRRQDGVTVTPCPARG
ncbi:hypothetical protein [Nesterenkonia ebinurensis]|uniref:hypothetical protein n=1 Tax=Nesterenkonia ebinurensis TaxID=2608252 RepID=UPI00168A9C20|nr:hypothetical protein [Nesterenkonia ebinurensis]